MTGELPAATKLAVDRTRLAHERTLMAWVRTAASLISFGFTIYKFFDFLRERQEGVAARTGIVGPRIFAMMMIAIGLAALVLATIGHRRSMGALRAEYGLALVPYSMATMIAALIGFLGVVGLLAVVFRQ